MVERAQKEMEENIHREGEKAVFEAGVLGLNPEIIKLLGRLKYRFSYGENVLKHAVEVSLLAGMLAAEIGANIRVAKEGGLLHDIGKALTHEVEGPHAEIGADIAKKYGIHPEVHRAIMEHHDEERGSVEAFLVAAADAISAARPGARKETTEHYVKGWRLWKGLPPASQASKKPLPFRLAAKSESWSSLRQLTIWAPLRLPATLQRKFRRSWYSRPD